VRWSPLKETEFTVRVGILVTICVILYNQLMRTNFGTCEANQRTMGLTARTMAVEKGYGKINPSFKS